MAVDKKSPFIGVTCKCPICTREAHHRYVKSKLYKPGEVEDDQHVVTYKWESPRFDGIRPNYYHIWHCPFCRFSDEKEVFRGDDTSGGKLELIREKLLIASKANYSLITRLGNAINLEQEFVSQEAALCAHLQAIYIQEMLSPNMRQYGKLGRYYLRTAWLYREKNSWNAPEQGVPSGYQSLEDFLISLREEWPELPLNETAAMEKAIYYYQGDLDRFRRVDDAKHEIQVLFLLVDLYRRLGKREQAVKIVRAIFQMATRKRQTTRHTLDGAINRGKGTARQIESMRSLLIWLNNSIERATNLSEDFNNEIFKEEYVDARERVLKMKKPSVKGIMEYLKSEGFHEVTGRRIAAMFSKKLLEHQKEAQPEKKPTSEKPSEGETPKKKRGFLNSIFDKLSSD